MDGRLWAQQKAPTVDIYNGCFRRNKNYGYYFGGDITYGAWGGAVQTMYRMLLDKPYTIATLTPDTVGVRTLHIGAAWKDKVYYYGGHAGGSTDQTKTDLRIYNIAGD